MTMIKAKVKLFLVKFKLFRTQRIKYVKKKNYRFLQITFDIKDDGTLTERHVKVEDPSDIETYEYRIEGDYLVMVSFISE